MKNIYKLAVGVDDPSQFYIGLRILQATIIACAAIVTSISGIGKLCTFPPQRRADPPIRERIVVARKRTLQVRHSDSRHKVIGVHARQGTRSLAAHRPVKKSALLEHLRPKNSNDAQGSSALCVRQYCVQKSHIVGRGVLRKSTPRLVR